MPLAINAWIITITIRTADGPTKITENSPFVLRLISWDIFFRKEKAIMAVYVITEPCIGTKDTACVDVCPVDCIHPRKDEPEYGDSKMLFINPDECIDCGACQPACPVEAIYRDEDVPEQWQDYVALNANHYK